MGKNAPAWGLDLNADPLRRSVTDRARDTGQLASSSGVTLLRDGNSSVSSTLLRLALYRGGGVPGSVEARRGARCCLTAQRRALRSLQSPRRNSPHTR